MVVALTIEKMIQFYHGNIHDVSHFLKVYAFAKTIGELERLTPQTQETLELAAVVHDIACPLCREKYGSTNGKKQELESPPLIGKFFSDLPVAPETVQRISWIVAHHHIYGLSNDLDYQILLEADYLVNAEKNSSPAESARSAMHKIFKTKTGGKILSELYLN